MPDIPAEAVEAAYRRAWNHIPADNPTPNEVRAAVAAAMTAAWPFARAQILAEVDAALRDWERYVAWARKANLNGWSTNHLDDHADYLRDTLAGDGGEA